MDDILGVIINIIKPNATRKQRKDHKGGDKAIA